MVRARLRQLFDDFHEIDPSEDLRLIAERVLAVHPLRVADALQLACALVWARQRPLGHDFVCFDRRLREAAEREGFTILPPTTLCELKFHHKESGGEISSK